MPTVHREPNYCFSRWIWVAGIRPQTGRINRVPFTLYHYLVVIPGGAPFVVVNDVGVRERTTDPASDVLLPLKPLVQGTVEVRPRGRCRVRGPNQKGKDQCQHFAS